jgi:hypothetical protein
MIPNIVRVPGHFFVQAGFMDRTHRKNLVQKTRIIGNRIAIDLITERETRIEDREMIR